MNPIKRKHKRTAFLAAAFIILSVALKLLYDFHPIVHLRHKLLRGSDQYYSQLAEACYSLWQGHPLETKSEMRMLSDDITNLPVCLKDLSVLSIHIKTNGVGLWWGGFVDFSLQCHHVSNNEWQLSYVDDDKGVNKPLYRQTFDDQIANKTAHPSSQGLQGDR